jgi:hypothetical protein
MVSMQALGLSRIWRSFGHPYSPTFSLSERGARLCHSVAFYGVVSWFAASFAAALLTPPFSLVSTGAGPPSSAITIQLQCPMSSDCAPRGLPIRARAVSADGDLRGAVADPRKSVSQLVWRTFSHSTLASVGRAPTDCVERVPPARLVLCDGRA